ncbi:MAG: hypothetical protein ABFC67_04730 [Mizugakiibacter sp.]|uniref:hypothetical protein n=1 Tax=Mizugakiibacter sp. TaxID=1972610 RepID=UPI00320D3B54
MTPRICLFEQILLVALILLALFCAWLNRDDLGVLAAFGLCALVYGVILIAVRRRAHGAARDDDEEWEAA